MPERTEFSGVGWAILLAAAAAALGGTVAHAQQDTTPPPAVTQPSDGAGVVPTGSCFQKPAKLDESVVKDFLDYPSALLALTNPSLIPQVRALVGTDAATVTPILETAAVAGPEQQLGFGTGLAQGALGCLQVRYDVSRYIQQEVAKAGLENVLVAFMATAGEIETAALGLGSGAPAGASARGAAIGAGGRVAGSDYEQEFPVAVNGPTAFLFNNGAFGFAGESGSSTFVVSPAEQ